MYKSKLIQVLKTFSKVELKEFRDFVISPFHNKNKSVIKLYEIIRKQNPASHSQFLDKKIAYSKLYPGKEYNDTVMRIFMSDLLKLSEEYLVYSRLERSIAEYRVLLLSEFLERRLNKMFIQAKKDADNFFKNCPIDDEFFRSKFDIEELNKGFNIIRDKQHLNSTNLVLMSELTLINFLMKMSSIVHDINVNKINFNVQFGNMTDSLLNLINTDSITKIFESSSNENREIIEIYYCALRLNEEQENDKNFHRLKLLFEKNIKSFTHETGYNMYMALLNYCSKKHWTDNDDFYKREQLRLFKEMLARGLYSWAKDEYMSIINFRSILMLCSMLKEFNWMEFFINNYIDKLAPEQKENMYYYSNAKLYFSKKDYNKALEFISKVNYELFNFKYDVKSLTLQIYYELNYIEEAFNLIDTFKHFLTNNKNVSKSFKDWNMNFLSFYKDLLHIKSRKNNVVFPVLRKKLLETPNVASKNWLLGKVEEIGR